MSDTPKSTKQPHINGRFASVPVMDRFWAKVSKTDDCWLWTAYTYPNGYGQFWFNGKMGYAHRFAYQQAKGAIPEGLEIDHLCGVRNCVNPDHLEAVTHRENVLRGNAPSAKHAGKTHCKRGHEFTEVNTIVTSRGRMCRACHRDLQRVYRARKKANQNQKQTGQH